jgi:hypothetical protein
MKKVAFSVITLLALNFSGCSSDSTTPTPASTTQTVTTTLTGANESPAVTTTSTGSVAGTYNKTTKILSIVVTHNIAAPTGGHIHKGAAGANGSVIFPFPTPLTSPITYSTRALTDAELADLTAGLYYVNLHTTTNAGGEIRGQLTLK